MDLTWWKWEIVQFFMVALFESGCVSEKYTGKVLLVGYDGFRWDYMNLTDTPNLDQFKAEGTSTPYINNVFTSITFPSMYTIVTGLYPESHGIVGYTMYDSVFNSTWTSSNSESRWYNDGEPIWVTAGKAGLRTGSYMWLGSSAEIRDYRPDFWLPYNGSHSFKDRVDQVIQWFLEEDVSVVAFYYHEPDAIGHKTGPASESAIGLEMVRTMDQNTGYLMQQLEAFGLSSQVNVILTSDHGMTSSSLTDRTIDIYDYVSRGDIYTVADEGAVVNILPVEGREEAVYKALSGAHPNMTVYYKEDLPQRWHFTNHRRIHPIILVADEGWLIYSNKSNWPAPMRGMHGYDNALMSMKPFFLAKGPNIKKNYQVPPFSQTDIYPLMCELLDVLCSPHNGSLDNVQSMLQSSSPPQPGVHGEVRASATQPTATWLQTLATAATILLTYQNWAHIH